LQDQQVGTVELLDLRGDIRGDPPLVRGMALLGLDVEALRLPAQGIMLGPLAGVEPMA
jgi:hypothetical protein